MAEIENGYYYIEDGVVLKEDAYTNSVDKVGKVVGFDYEQEIRNKAIEEFAERIKTSELAWNWCCHDTASELCDNNCAKCMTRFEEQIDEIAESMKGEK